MRALLRPRFVLAAVLLITAGSVYYVTRDDSPATPAVAAQIYQPQRQITSHPAPDQTPLVSQKPSEVAGAVPARAARGDEPLPTRTAELSPLKINDLRNEITALEKSMLKHQIAMNNMLRSGVIADPDPERSDVPVSMPVVNDSTHQIPLLDIKASADSYMEHKANYLGQKALWKAIKARLRAAEFAQEAK